MLRLDRLEPAGHRRQRGLPVDRPPLAVGVAQQRDGRAVGGVEDRQRLPPLRAGHAEVDRVVGRGRQVDRLAVAQVDVQAATGRAVAADHARGRVGRLAARGPGRGRTGPAPGAARGSGGRPAPGASDLSRSHQRGSSRCATLMAASLPASSAGPPRRRTGNARRARRRAGEQTSGRHGRRPDRRGHQRPGRGQQQWQHASPPATPSARRSTAGPASRPQISSADRRSGVSCGSSQVGQDARVEPELDDGDGHRGGRASDHRQSPRRRLAQRPRTRTRRAAASPAPARAPCRRTSIPLNCRPPERPADDVVDHHRAGHARDARRDHRRRQGRLERRSRPQPARIQDRRAPT